MTIKEVVKDAGPGMVAAFAIGAVCLTIILIGLGVTVNLVFFK